MSLLEQTERFSSLQLEQGLYTFRYVSAADSVPPVADFEVLEGLVDFVCAPGRKERRLLKPGTSVVFVVKISATLRVRVTPGRLGGDTSTEFGLDLLDRGLDPVVSHALRATTKSAPLPISKIEPSVDLSLMRVEAHVSRLGDIAAKSGDWIAGPQAPLPIEGLLVACPTERDLLGVAIQMQSMQSRPAWSPWYKPEIFAGSHQRADALAGVRLKLVGSLAGDFALFGEALFLGAPILSQQGGELEFVGSDPLVGLRLVLVPSAKQDAPVSQAGSERVRIYRAR